MRIAANVTATHNLSLISISILFYYFNNFQKISNFIINLFLIISIVLLVSLELFAVTLQLYVINMLSTYYILD